eukprot:257632-Hanusia_phi.AAC.1
MLIQVHLYSYAHTKHQEVAALHLQGRPSGFASPATFKDCRGITNGVTGCPGKGEVLQRTVI